MSTLTGVPDTESFTVGRDRATGLVAVIAIDDTTLGPALGGIRWTSYASEEAAIIECRRLGRVMSLKNALADIGYGGGKSVILASPAITDRRAALLAFGRLVARMGGAYLPAADMGTGVEDLRIVRETALDTSCHDADPSVSTAIGVHAAIAQAVRAINLSPGLQGITVLIQGAGAVGARLATLLAADGARILIADIDKRRAADVAARVSGAAIDVAETLSTPCDVFAPCAGARVIDDETARRLPARLVAGAANDVLADPGVAETLTERGITYVPDFVANAGGVIQVRALRDGWSDARLQDALRAIGQRTADILDEASGPAGATPLAVAESAAYALLGRTRPPVNTPASTPEATA